MKLLQKIIAAISVLFVLGCTQQSSDSTIVCTESTQKPIDGTFVCELGEDIAYQNMTMNFRFIDDSRYIVFSFNEPHVCMYDLSGRQICTIGRKGRARGEYLFPNKAAVYDEKIYISCSPSKKILAFDMDGKFIEEYKNFHYRRRDFAVTERYIYQYGVNNHYIGIYDRAQESEIAYIGKYSSDADKVLGDMSWTNILCEYNDGVLYVDPVTLSVYSVVGEDRELLFDLSIPHYNVDDNVDYDDFLSGDYEKTKEYIDKCSTVTYVNVSDDKLYVVVAHGGSNDCALVIADLKTRKATYRPILDRSENGVIIRDFKFVNGDMYALVVDADSQYLERLNIQ